jgi:predicted phage terminase large subunit-like protein
LLVYGLDRQDADNDWVFDRCREVQAEPNGRLDLWAREHYKSTIITFALTIQDVLNDPELTVGIFSHTRPIAKQFLRQIKLEFERNEKLKRWFPDVLWEDPRKEAPKWSEDEGIVVRRRTNPKEATIEAWGLVDGQPTSKHFRLGVYDDVVTRESVSTIAMIRKTTQAWELSRNLMAVGGASRYIGTRYAYADTYAEMMKRGIRPRIYAATRDGTADGEPWLMPREVLAQKRIEMQDTFWPQMMMEPRATADAYFQREWFRWFRLANAPSNLRTYGASDYAVTAGGGDWTVHGVVGLDTDDNIYLLDLWRGKTESHVWVEAFIDLVARHKPLAWAEESGQITRSLDPFIRRRMLERRVYCLRRPFSSAADKPTRARAFQARAAMGKVFLPEDAPWIDDLLHVLLSFPLGEHDDDVDMLGLIGRMLDTMQGARKGAPERPPPSKWDQAFARRRAAAGAAAAGWKGL